MFLIDNGANINATTSDGYSLIHIAADSEWTNDILIAIIDKNVPIDAQTDSLYTPAHIILIIYKFYFMQVQI